jgi:hypothetical protein
MLLYKTVAVLQIAYFRDVIGLTASDIVKMITTHPTVFKLSLHGEHSILNEHTICLSTTVSLCTAAAALWCYKSCCHGHDTAHTIAVHVDTN